MLITITPTGSIRGVVLVRQSSWPGWWFKSVLRNVTYDDDDDDQDVVGRYFWRNDITYNVWAREVRFLLFHPYEFLWSVAEISRVVCKVYLLEACAFFEIFFFSLSLWGLHSCCQLASASPAMRAKIWTWKMKHFLILRKINRFSMQCEYGSNNTAVNRLSFNNHIFHAKIYFTVVLIILHQLSISWWSASLNIVNPRSAWKSRLFAEQSCHIKKNRQWKFEHLQKQHSFALRPNANDSERENATM